MRRLTRFRYNNAPLDGGGRYIYLRDDEAAAQEPGSLFWSPSWQPVRQPLDEYECRHGLGYTTIRSKQAGIQSQTRYFIPLGENLEIWEVTLTNQRGTTAGPVAVRSGRILPVGRAGRRRQFSQHRCGLLTATRRHRAGGNQGHHPRGR